MKKNTRINIIIMLAQAALVGVGFFNFDLIGYVIILNLILIGLSFVFDKDSHNSAIRLALFLPVSSKEKSNEGEVER